MRVRATEVRARVADRENAQRRFERAYVDAWPSVFAYAWVLLRKREDAEDVASETFLRAYSAWLDGREPREAITPWLFLIARRIVIDRQRRHRLIAWLPLNVGHDVGSADHALDASETAVWFGQLAAALTSRQHEALLLRYEFDLRDEQIGRIMGISAGSVRTLVSRAVAALRARPEVWK